jgi:hypothetical protein
MLMILLLLYGLFPAALYSLLSSQTPRINPHQPTSTYINPDLAHIDLVMASLLPAHDGLLPYWLLLVSPEYYRTDSV